MTKRLSDGTTSWPEAINSTAQMLDRKRRRLPKVIGRHEAFQAS